MTWHRQDNFHNGREYLSDEATGGFLAWLRRQFTKLLRAGGEPGPATILYTHALDDELSGMAGKRDRHERTRIPHSTPFDTPLP